MNQKLKNRLIRITLLSAIAFVVGGTLALIEISGQNAQVQNKAGMRLPVAGSSLRGEFDLVDHTGQPTTHKAYEGQYTLTYFGFTFCPAICPTELQKISRVLDALGEASKQIQPLFITLDPARDTVPVMKDYISLFHPRLIGLTGTQDQIDKTLHNFRVYARKVQEPDMNDYTMDHSSYIYLMSPDHELISIYRIEDNTDYIVKDIKAKL